MRTVASLQSNYIPWKGYFDIIHDVDEFIFCDDLQYTVKDWRNRNKILVGNKEVWLTVPVGKDEHRTILETEIKDSKWQKKHYDTIYMAYHRKPYYKRYEEFLQHVYLEKEWTHLYLLDRYMIEHIATEFLGCKTKFTDSRDYYRHGVKHERLLNMLKDAKADVYVSGPAAKDYIIVEDYQNAGIELIWKDYSGYPEYSQSGAFVTHNVSILDLLFNTGPEASYYIWGWREQ